MSDIGHNWRGLRLEATRLFLSFVSRETHEGAQDAFDQATINNVGDFLDYAEKHFPVADGIDHGYWPTICLYWPAAVPYPVHIEIFDDHFELYRQIPRMVDVSHFDHKAGEPFPPKLAAILSEELH